MQDQPNAPNNATEAAENAENKPAAAESAAQGAEVIAALETEVADLKDRLLRQLAETENVRKRAERERAEAAKYGIVPFVRDMLSVADNLARTLQAVPSVGAGAEALQSLIEGVELTERELVQAFERHGIKRVDPKGETFNPNLHQAVAEIPAPGVASGTVVEVVQCGYVLGERLIRAAMVVVAGNPGNSQVDTQA